MASPPSMSAEDAGRIVIGLFGPLEGLPCPMPIVKLAKAMKELDSQQVVLLESTDLCSVPDVAAWSAVKAR